jgi:hypothetical protein
MSDRRAPIELVTVAQLVEMFSSTLGADKSAEEITQALQRLGIYGPTLSTDQATALLEAMSKSPGMVGITARVAKSKLELGRAPSPSYPEITRTTEMTPRPARPPTHSGVRPSLSWPLPTSRSTPTPTPGGHGTWTPPDGTQSSSGPAVPPSFSSSLPDDSPASSRVEPSGYRSGLRADEPPSAPSPGRTVTPAEVASLLANALSPEGCLEAVRNAVRTLGLPNDHLDKAQAVAVLDLLAKEPGPLGLCARFGKARLILRFAA